MKWDELTMAQKNELMKTYIRNGVTSLDQMRSHFNSFALGGDKDNPDNPPVSKIPTRNEYLAQRAAEEQEQYFLQGSRNRNESYDLHRPLNPDEIENLKGDLIFVNRGMNSNIENLSKDAGIPITEARHYLSKHRYPIEWEGEFSDWFSAYNYYEDKKKDIQKALKEKVKYLYNCLATATSNHPYPGHFVTGNEAFRANPSKYGWKEVSEKEIIPGGLIQMLGRDGTPIHAVIFDSYNNGRRLVNYSPGSYPIYKKQKQDWEPSEREYFYNFVGNHADSLRWNNEYEQLYGKHALGGYLFATGGPKKTFQEWSQAMKGKYPWLELDPNKAGYDYERYFNENYDDAIARLNEAEARHFTDKYKLPNHLTYSDESTYSEGPRIGGSWTRDGKFIPSVINTQQHPNIYRESRPYTEDEIYARKREISEPVNLKAMVENNPTYGQNKYIDTLMLRNLDNFLIQKEMPLPQRQALAFSSQQEGNTTNAHGNGAYGLVGWRGARATPIINKSLEEQAEYLYNTLMNYDPNHWNHGGKGSGFKTGKDAQKAFINATTAEDAIKALNYGYIIPPQDDRIFRVNNIKNMFGIK